MLKVYIVVVPLRSVSHDRFAAFSKASSSGCAI